jgi:biotin carboxyl carrier protein
VTQPNRAAADTGPRFTVTVGTRGEPSEPAAGWSFSWTDRAAGIGRLSDGHRHLAVVVEGSGSEWFVTLRGRRVPVAVRSRREDALAAATAAEDAHTGPLEIRASLPGLVVAIQAQPGGKVAEGDPLLRLEAMKMQNELRAPRAGRVIAILVEAGQTVGTGDVLLRLE